MRPVINGMEAVDCLEIPVNNIIKRILPSVAFSAYFFQKIFQSIL
jgi:hypothetical protein